MTITDEPTNLSNEKVQIERFINNQETSDDQLHLSNSPKLRPELFKDYPGQDHVKSNLKIYVEAAKGRNQPLDHVLLHGPPGLGKTTLAHIIANELGVKFYQASGPSIDKPGDLAGIMAGLEEGSLIFIDEIHRLSIQVEEVLYSAMEDYCLDVIVGQGPSARSVRMPISPFTLVGATTRISSLSRPLLSRFGIQERLEYYDISALVKILERSAAILSVNIEQGGAEELARRSRGTPRIANRILRRVWDFAEVQGNRIIDKALVENALKRLDIDRVGLDRTDREILKTIHKRYKGGPVGIETLAITIGEEKSTIEDVYEPFLVHQGFLDRGPRGRSITAKAVNHLNIRD